MLNTFLVSRRKGFTHAAPYNIIITLLVHTIYIYRYTYCTRIMSSLSLTQRRVGVLSIRPTCTNAEHSRMHYAPYIIHGRRYIIRIRHEMSILDAAEKTYSSRSWNERIILLYFWRRYFCSFSGIHTLIIIY